MNENTDMVDNLLNAFKRILTTIGGVGLLAVLVCCLFAPALAGLVQNNMMKNPDGSFIPLSQIPDVYRQMIPVRIWLWIICLSAWAFVIWCNLYWKY